MSLASLWRRQRADLKHWLVIEYDLCERDDARHVRHRVRVDIFACDLYEQRKRAHLRPDGLVPRVATWTTINYNKITCISCIAMLELHTRDYK